MDYIEVTFKNVSADNMPLLEGLLSSFEHNGILEEDQELSVYFLANEFLEGEMSELAKQFDSRLEVKTIVEKNWNQEWEQHFEPVVIDDFCGIRADFHQPIAHVQHELIITPKMSFGTGHHATTFLMIQNMAQLDLKGKKVFDYGCGTGVLSILAEKLGASSVMAIDIDEWSLQNTIENITLNHCHRIEVKNEAISTFSSSFDCIFANINRNVLLASMTSMAALIAPQGSLLLSGILWEDDVEIIKSSAAAAGLKFCKESHKNNWAALVFQK